MDQFPDSGWAWIGWADRYTPHPGTPEEYEHAEAILQRALNRPTLHERIEVLDRLLQVYELWDKSEKIEPYLAEWDILVAEEERRSKGRKW